MTTRPTRRQFIAGVLANTVAHQSAAALAAEEPSGEIAFIKDGDVWRWRAGGEITRIIEDGAAMDPTWDPAGGLLMYVRDGGSYADLILANPENQLTEKLTDNESDYSKGSELYVQQSIWLIDPCWSASGIAVVATDLGSDAGLMTLWICGFGDPLLTMALTDGTDPGPIEHPSVDADGVYCVYTTLVADASGGTTLVNLRDLNTGATWTLPFGGQGAYDPAISPDGRWIAAAVRDESGESDLVLCHREREEVTRLTENERVSAITWSPTGDWIAYMKYDGKRFTIRALRIDPQDGRRIGKARTLVELDGLEATSGLTWRQ